MNGNIQQGYMIPWSGHPQMPMDGLDMSGRPVLYDTYMYHPHYVHYPHYPHYPYYPHQVYYPHHPHHPHHPYQSQSSQYLHHPPY